MARDLQPAHEALTFLYEALEQTRALSLDEERSGSLVLIATLEAFHGDARPWPCRPAGDRQVAVGGGVLGLATRLGAPLYIAVQVFNRAGRPDLVARCSGYSRQQEYSSTRMYTYFHDLAVDEAKVGPRHGSVRGARGGRSGRSGRRVRRRCADRG